MHDRGAEHREGRGRALGRRLVDAADDAGEGRDLLEEPTGRDPLWGMGHEQVLAHPQPTPLLEIAGDELGGPGRDRRAQDQGLAGAQHREQVVHDGAHAAQIGLDVGERRGADRDHDVVGAGRVGRALGQLEAPAGHHALEQLLGARLFERHPAGAHRGEHGRVVVDSEHAEAAIGEGQGQGQGRRARDRSRTGNVRRRRLGTSPSSCRESDFRVRGHAAQRLEPRLGLGARAPRRRTRSGSGERSRARPRSARDGRAAARGSACGCARAAGARNGGWRRPSAGARPLRSPRGRA